MAKKQDGSATYLRIFLTFEKLIGLEVMLGFVTRCALRKAGVPLDSAGKKSKKNSGY